MSIAPGSTIGIVGGGQLGRMLAMAAAQLGYKCHIYAPDEAPPAAEVSAFFTRGDFDDEAKLRAFGAAVDVATYEFENIAAGPLAALTGQAPLSPPRAALEIAQDRLTEKEFILEHGGRPAPFAAVDNLAGLEAALAGIGTPAILKTRRLGYDGKGQVRIGAADEAAAAWKAVRGAPCVLEAMVGFDAEFAILLCRSPLGEVACWDAPRNIHDRGILDRSVVPAEAALEPAIAAAESLARRVANALDYVGVMAMEFFAVGREAVFNEMAPRVHNSGHWTIEGALTSQFENHVRAICGLPLGATERIARRVEMRNLIGADVEQWPEILADRTAHLHLYGKSDTRAGRKMGHVTRLIGVAR
ncbi:MAG: 5-(carboxyamino)imidazole ribonucleotide synthase [Allosphingosinicella sp.]